MTAEVSGRTSPRRRRRSWQNAFIAAFVLFQIAVPLRYYLGDDPFDERFAWRMFSDVRLRSCKPELLEHSEAGKANPGLRQTALNSLVQATWVTSISKNGRQVIEKLLRRRCEEAGQKLVRITNRCVTPGGEPLPLRVYERDCQSGALRFTEEPP